MYTHRCTHTCIHTHMLRVYTAFFWCHDFYFICTPTFTAHSKQTIDNSVRTFFLKTATKQVSTFAKHSFIIRNKLFCIKISMHWPLHFFSITQDLIQSAVTRNKLIFFYKLNNVGQERKLSQSQKSTYKYNIRHDLFQQHFCHKLTFVFLLWFASFCEWTVQKLDTML